MSLPPHPFWLLLLCACVVWYAALIVYIGWKGVHDIRTMLSELHGSPNPRASGGVTGREEK